MGAPETDKSLASRVSKALERLERLTEEADGQAPAHAETVAEAVERLKRKVADKDG